MLSFLILALLASAHADETDQRRAYQLDPIIAEGSPAEALYEDAVLPAQKVPTLRNAASGQITRSLQNRLPVTVFDRGSPGGASSLLGIGTSSEDTEVQALGVPLNPAQGGGFDLSIFPQFLWADSRFRLGPSLGVFDPRAVAGTLTLVPWTQAAIQLENPPLAQVTGLASSAEAYQFSAGTVLPKRAALVAGLSAGRARGPSGSLSGNWEISPSVRGRYHLLATGIEATVPGPMGMSPNATQLSVRAIPVLQADFRFSSAALWKTSWFFDGSYLQYDDPDSAFDVSTRDHIRQYGWENALLLGSFRIGASARHVTLRQKDFTAPAETIFNLQVAETWEWGAWLVEPVLQAHGVTGYGFFPGGTLGVKRSLLERRLEPYVRFNFVRKVPSLTTRFYELQPYFQGNPDLRAERVWTIQTGADWREDRWEAGVQFLGQVRDDAQVGVGLGSPFVPYNAGTAWIVSAIPSLTWRPFDGALAPWSWQLSAQASRSRLAQGASPFPYQPEIQGVLTTQYEATRWSAGATVRAASSVVTSSGSPLGGYGYGDLFGSFRPTSFLELSSRLEDVLDRRPNFIEGFEGAGRRVSVALTGIF